MKVLFLTTFTFMVSFFSGLAQDKPIRFSNITEATVGLQIGKTTRVHEFSVDDNGQDAERYKYPIPRISSSFGALFGQRFFIGLGFSYAFQPSDGSSTVYEGFSFPNAEQHQVGVFAHTRLNFSKKLIRPYLELKGGYNHTFSGEPENPVLSSESVTWDGVFVEPALGIGIRLGGHGQLNVSLGYQFLNVWNRSEGLSSLSAFGPELRDAYHRLLLSVGFSFY